MNSENIVLSERRQAEKATYEISYEAFRADKSIDRKHTVIARGWEDVKMGSGCAMGTGLPLGDENVLEPYSDNGWTTV